MSLRWMVVASYSIAYAGVSECSQAGVICEKWPTSQLGRSGNTIKELRPCSNSAATYTLSWSFACTHHTPPPPPLVALP